MVIRCHPPKHGPHRRCRHALRQLFRHQRPLCAVARHGPHRLSVARATASGANSESADAVEEFDPAIPTFPELLREAGYRTALVGKYHIRQDPRGFDYWCIHPGQGEYFDPVFIENGREVQQQGYATDITTDLALRFLESSDASRPFCLVYQFKAPHRPFTPAPRHAELFADLIVPEPEDLRRRLRHPSYRRPRRGHEVRHQPGPDYGRHPCRIELRRAQALDYQRFVVDRYRTIVGVDENLGRMLDYLDDGVCRRTR